MRRLSRRQQRMRGRPIGQDTQIVMGLIEASTEPVSTHTLLAKLAEATKISEEELANLPLDKTPPPWDSRCVVIRKMLRAKERKGEIQCLGVGNDGSYMWVHNKISVLKCAALVANEFLKRCEADARLDPDEFEEWAATMRNAAGDC